MLQEGIELFNQRKFFEAHEIWERLWLNAKEEKKFLQGLIFIAGGYYHYQNKNIRGAKLFLERGINYLSKHNKEVNFIETGKFIKEVKETIQNIEYKFDFEPPRIALIKD